MPGIQRVDSDSVFNENDGEQLQLSTPWNNLPEDVDLEHVELDGPQKNLNRSFGFPGRALQQPDATDCQHRIIVAAMKSS